MLNQSLQLALAPLLSRAWVQQISSKLHFEGHKWMNFPWMIGRIRKKKTLVTSLYKSQKFLQLLPFGETQISKQIKSHWVCIENHRPNGQTLQTKVNMQKVAPREGENTKFHEKLAQTQIVTFWGINRARFGPDPRRWAQRIVHSEPCKRFFSKNLFQNDKITYGHGEIVVLLLFGLAVHIKNGTEKGREVYTKNV